MKFQELYDLTLNASRVETRQNPLGYNGYGFLVVDIGVANEEYFTSDWSSKLCSFEVSKYNDNEIIDPDLEIIFHSRPHFLYFLGSLKTILPSLQIGGDESLFSVWVFGITPSLESFPFTIYYGPSGLSIGAWTNEAYLKTFPSDFLHYINSSPFKWSENKLNGLISAFKSIIGGINFDRNFYGVFQHDGGFDLMGIRNGQAFSAAMGYSYDEIDVELYLGDIDWYLQKKEKKK